MSEIIRLNPSAPTAQVGFGVKFGNIITPAMITAGTPVTDLNGNPVTFKLLHIGVGGNVVVLGVDGNAYPLRDLLTGSWVPAWGSAILPSGTFNGVSVSTTATDIDWYSGI